MTARIKRVTIGNMLVRLGTKIKNNKKVDDMDCLELHNAAWNAEQQSIAQDCLTIWMSSKCSNYGLVALACTLLGHELLGDKRSR